MNVSLSLIQIQITNWALRRTPANGVRRVTSLSAAVASDVGNVREENQDRAIIVRGRDHRGQTYALIIVADGIGGMQDGGTCAALAVGAFIASVDLQAGKASRSNHSEEWLREAAHAANQAVFSKFRASGGSTLVALLARGGERPYWLSIGDSRVYYTDNKVLHQISIDDTIAGQLGKAPEESGDRSQLLQFIGMGSDLEPHIGRFSDDSAEAAILTTDGVHYLTPSPGWLGQIVRNSTDPGICVKRLIDLAKWCGGPDNATVAMITFPIDIQSDSPLPYRFLELWDAYGELQIIAQTSALEESLHSASDPGSLSSNSPQFPPVSHPAEAQPSSTSLKESKPRRGKTSRKKNKSSGESDKNLAKANEPELPQLHMEFPTKSG